MNSINQTAIFAFFILLSTSCNRDRIATLESQVAKLQAEKVELQSTVDALQAKIRELNESLSEVQHFDDDAIISSGFVSEIEGATSFTGSVYKTKIDGDFNGWEGETLFKMMDGSIWQQSSYAYTYHYAFMPDVIIYSKGGSYFMKVEDVEDEIKVRKIR